MAIEHLKCAKCDQGPEFLFNEFKFKFKQPHMGSGYPVDGTVIDPNGSPISSFPSFTDEETHS